MKNLRRIGKLMYPEGSYKRGHFYLSFSNTNGDWLKLYVHIPPELRKLCPHNSFLFSDDYKKTTTKLEGDFSDFLKKEFSNIKYLKVISVFNHYSENENLERNYGEGIEYEFTPIFN